MSDSMNNHGDLPEQLYELVPRLVEGDLSLQEFETLSQILAENASARSWYQEYISMHAMLHWDYSSPQGDMPQGDLQSSGSAPKEDLSDGLNAAILSDMMGSPQPASPTLGFLPGVWESSKEFLSKPASLSVAVSILTVSCMLITLALLKPVFKTSSDQPSNYVASESEKDAKPYLANISRLHDPKWSTGKPIYSAGQELREGQVISLESGLAKIYFYDGAMVQLQGPAKLEILSPNLGKLHSGKLVANVPEQAHGFQISTSQTQVIDHGTEFAVLASDETTFVHVFQGLVEVKSAENNRSISMLKTGQSCLVNSEQKIQHTSVAIDTNQFIRTMPRGSLDYYQSILADHPVAYWPISEPSNSTAIRDHSGNSHHGQAMDNAILGASGPANIKRGSALSLDGTGHLQFNKKNILSSGSRFSIEAWVWVDRPHRGRVISTNGREGGWAFGYYPILPNEGKANDPTNHSYIFTLYGNRAFVFSDVSVPLKKWQHVVVVYDDKLVANLYVDGKFRQKIQGTKPGKMKSDTIYVGCKTPGLRKWFGRIAQVTLYDHELTPKRIATHYQTMLNESELQKNRNLKKTTNEN